MPERAARLILAFDFGLRRIGVATGDTVSGTAAPRTALKVGARGPDWDALERELKTLRPQVLVVGQPLNVDGTPGSLTAAATEFAAELQRRSGLPVERVDERFSSLEAAARLKAARAAGRRGRVQHADIDSAAAAIILERWLHGEGT